MSTAEEKKWENCSKVIHAIEPSFNALARVHNAVDFKTQAEFALAILKSNSTLAKVAYENQDSLREAIVNVAAVGLSLSPVDKCAYLVPRDGRVCLDIAARGLVRLAVEANVLLWAKPELVHDNDDFEFLGVNTIPLHKYKPFRPRGEIIGGYSLAKTPDGSYLVDYMPIFEIIYIRDTYSPSWKAYLRDKTKTTPWRTSFGEMCKKTLIRRGEKHWPMTSNRSRLDKALQVSLDADGFIAHEEPKQISTDPSLNHGNPDSSLVPKINSMLTTLKRDRNQFIQYLEEIFRRQIESLDDLTDSELEVAVGTLTPLIPKETLRENVI